MAQPNTGDTCKCSKCGGSMKGAVINVIPKNHLFILATENDGNRFAPSSKVESRVCPACGYIELFAQDVSVFAK
jgi:hypothetical protein